MRIARSYLLLLCLAFLVGSPAVLAWGCIGHETVALVAEKNLHPNALACVNRLLKENPVDPSLSRYCPMDGLDAIADAATWADDYRSSHRYTGDWHFLDIARGAKKSEMQKFCIDSKCITAALPKQVSILKSSPDPQKQAQALRFVIHLVGDIHQPLHCVSNNDRGGNCVPVAYFDAKPELKNPRYAYYVPNLHKVWDEDIVEHEAQGMSPEQFASQLNERYHSKFSSWTKGGASFDDWAWESHQLAEKVAYRKLPHKIPIETPQTVNSCKEDNCIAERMLKLDERIEGPYQKAAGTVACQQIAKAGFRLASLLNEIFPEPATQPAEKQ